MKFSLIFFALASLSFAGPDSTLNDFESTLSWGFWPSNQSGTFDREVSDFDSQDTVLVWSANAGNSTIVFIFPELIQLGNFTHFQFDIKKSSSLPDTSLAMHFKTGANPNMGLYVPVSEAWETRRVRIDKSAITHWGQWAIIIPSSSAGTIYLNNLALYREYEDSSLFLNTDDYTLEKSLDFRNSFPLSDAVIASPFTWGNNYAMMHEDACYSDSEGLHLTTREAYSEGVLLDTRDLQGRLYQGCEVRVKQYFLYGIFVFKMQVLGSDGTMQAAFLYDSPEPGEQENIWIEVDFEFPEFFGENLNRFLSNVYKTDSWSSPGLPEYFNVPFNFSQEGGLTGALKWTPDTIAYYIENAEGELALVHTITDSSKIPQHPMQFRVNNWIPNAGLGTTRETGSEIILESFQYYSLSGTPSFNQPAPRPSFYCRPLAGHKPLVTECQAFNDRGQIDSFYWELDSTTIDSSLNIRYTFTSSGPRDISLHVTGNDTTVGLTREDYINAGPNRLPNLLVYSTYTEVHVGDTASILASATDPDFDLLNWYTTDAPEGLEIVTLPGDSALIKWQPEDSDIGRHTLIICVTDFEDTTCSGSTIEVTAALPVPPSGLNYSFGDSLSYTLDQPIDTNKLTFTGSEATLIAISPSLPEGLVFDENNGFIYGTPTELSDETKYTVRVTNAAGEDSVQLFLSVRVQPPYNLSYSDGLVQTYLEGDSITPNVLTYQGGAAESITITQKLPAGLEMDSNGIISGIPKELFPLSNFWVKVTNESGSDSISLTLQVVARPITEITYSEGLNHQYKVGDSIVPNILNYSGTRATGLYVDSLPSGLSIDSTGRIFGIPTEAQDTTAYTVTIENPGDTQLVVLQIEVVDVVATKELQLPTKYELKVIASVASKNQIIVGIPKGEGNLFPTVEVQIYDLMGHLKKTLMSGPQSPGYQIISLHSLKLPNGIYFLNMKAPKYLQTIRIFFSRGI